MESFGVILRTRESTSLGERLIKVNSDFTVKFVNAFHGQRNVECFTGSGSRIQDDIGFDNYIHRICIRSKNRRLFNQLIEHTEFHSWFKIESGYRAAISR